MLMQTPAGLTELPDANHDLLPIKSLPYTTHVEYTATDGNAYILIVDHDWRRDLGCPTKYRVDSILGIVAYFMGIKSGLPVCPVWDDPNAESDLIAALCKDFSEAEMFGLIVKAFDRDELERSGG